MNLDVVLLPKHLESRHFDGRTVVVLDVLRATTTMTAALDAGVSEVRVFASLDDASRAGRSIPASASSVAKEKNCLPPAGFDWATARRVQGGASRGPDRLHEHNQRHPGDRRRPKGQIDVGRRGRKCVGGSPGRRVGGATT
jgi:hypothetical protein